MEKLGMIEDKLKQLQEELTTKSNYLAQIVGAIEKLSNDKKVTQDDIHVLSGAAQAYQNTLNLMKEAPQESKVLEGEIVNG